MKMKSGCSCCNARAQQNRGLFLRGQYLCGDCEAKLVADTVDSQGYQNWLSFVRESLFKKASGYSAI